MAKTAIPKMEFREEDLLVQVDKYRVNMAQGNFSKSELIPALREAKEKCILSKKQLKVKGDYESNFLVVKDTGRRQNVSVTISREYHSIITRVLGGMGDSNLKIVNYLNNIIGAHFKLYSEEIDEFHKTNQAKSLFKD